MMDEDEVRSAKLVQEAQIQLLERPHGARLEDPWSWKKVSVSDVHQLGVLLHTPQAFTSNSVHTVFVIIEAERELLLELRSFLQFRLDLHLKRGRWDHNHTSSSTARLLSSRNQDCLVFETPWNAGPYLYVLLSREGSGEEPPQAHWRGVFFSNTADTGIRFDDYWQYFYALLHRPRPTLPTYITPGLTFPLWLMEKYSIEFQRQSTPISNQIEGISTALEQEMENPIELATLEYPSSVLRQLNTCSNTLRTSRLGEQMTFTLEAFLWEEHMRPNEKVRAKMLQLRVKCEELHPDRLKERIEELRERVRDLNTLRQQEHEEKRLKNKLIEESKRRKDKDAQESTKEALQNLRDEIMLQNIHDARTMRGIAWVTVSFLPATFVSSFFGMNFFNGVAGPVPFDAASRNVWVFFVIALPISVIVLAIFWRWDEQKRREGEEKINEDRRKLMIPAIERRERSRTNRVLSKVLWLREGKTGMRDEM